MAIFYLTSWVSNWTNSQILGGENVGARGKCGCHPGERLSPYLGIAQSVGSPRLPRVDIQIAGTPQTSDRLPTNSFLHFRYQNTEKGMGWLTHSASTFSSKWGIVRCQINKKTGCCLTNITVAIASPNQTEQMGMEEVWYWSTNSSMKCVLL